MTLGIGRIDHDFGFIEKCAYCERTNVPKTTKNQITCGGGECRRKRNAARARARARKVKRRV